MKLHIEDLRQMPADELIDLYSQYEEGTAEEELITEALSTYHHCDVCDSYSSLDEPCEFH